MSSTLKNPTIKTISNTNLLTPSLTSNNTQSFVSPIRNINNSNTNYLQYNPTSKEITYGSSEVSKRLYMGGYTNFISFPFTFASVPSLVMSFEINRTDYFWTCQLLSVSTTGFNIRVMYSNGVNFTYGAGGGDTYYINYNAKLTN